MAGKLKDSNAWRGRGYGTGKPKENNCGDTNRVGLMAWIPKDIVVGRVDGYIDGIQ